jgi:hypothetical protein
LAKQFYKTTPSHFDHARTEPTWDKHREIDHVETA